MQYFSISRMIGPADLLHSSPAPHFKTFQVHGAFHMHKVAKLEVDDAIPVKVMPVTVEDLRKQHVCSLLP
jgi:hypothetical protein